MRLRLNRSVLFHFHAFKLPRRSAVSLITLSCLQRSITTSLALQFRQGIPISAILFSSFSLKRFGSMTQAHCFCLYCSLDLTLLLCLNRCTEDLPPFSWFCRRCFVAVAQRKFISVLVASLSKHRRPDICAPDPHLRPHGSGCTDLFLIPNLGLSGSHSAFLTPQFRLCNHNSYPRPLSLNLRCLDSIGQVPWCLSCGFLAQV